MAFLFNSFLDWQEYCQSNDISLYQSVLEYEIEQRGRKEEDIWEKAKYH